MTVWEVLLCCSASIPYKGYSVWVQNSISYHLTGCSWILFPAQQGSNTVPDLYFVGIRSVLPVPAFLSAPARDGWSSGVGNQGQSVPTSPSEQGTRQLGPHPAGKVWREERGSEKSRDHATFSEEVRQGCGDGAGLRRSWEHKSASRGQSAPRVRQSPVIRKISVMRRQLPGQTGKLGWGWVSGVRGQAQGRAGQLQHSSDEGQAWQPQLNGHSCARGRAATESSSSFLLKNSKAGQGVSELAFATQSWTRVPCSPDSHWDVWPLCPI